MLGAVGSIIESKIDKEAGVPYKHIFDDWEKLKDQLVSYSFDKDGKLQSHQNFLKAGGTQVCQEYVKLFSALSSPFVYDSGSFLYGFGSSCKFCPFILLMMCPVGSIVCPFLFMILQYFNLNISVSDSALAWELPLTGLIFTLVCFLPIRIMCLCIGYRKGKEVMSELGSRYAADRQTYRRLTPAIPNKCTDVELFKVLKLSGYQSRNEQHSAPGTGCSK